jgi:DNA polymerase III, delta subunit
MSDLLLSIQTAKHVASYSAHPPHALGIVGSKGAGKAAIAEEIAASVLDVTNLENYGYFRRFLAEKDSITIEQAREIVSFTKLKTTGTRLLRRVIIIENAETMTQEAQNAILKVIEEPPADTMIILTISSRKAVLPTIISRLQILPVVAPSLEESQVYFATCGFQPEAIQKAYVMSGGSVGLMHGLLDQDTQHPLVAHIEQAKEILKADTFERLMMIDKIVKNKQTAEVLYGLQQTAQSALVMSAGSTNTAAVERWQSVLRNVTTARKLLSKNTQTKLVLTNLLVSL